MAQDQVTHTLQYLLSIGARLTIGYGIWRAIRAVRQRRHPVPPAETEAAPVSVPTAPPVGEISVPLARRVAGQLPDLEAEAANPETPPTRLGDLATDARLAAMVAANPATPEHVLETLSTSWNPAAWQAIVANPNASPSLLLRLGPRYPAAFFANPILSLLLIEQPDLLFRYDAAALSPLLQHPAADAGFLAVLTHHPDPRLAAEARLHVNLGGPSAPGAWQREAEDAIWRLPARSVESWARGMVRDDHDHLITVLAEGAVPAWLIPPLVVQGDDAVRRAVARSRRVPRSVLAPFRRAGARGDLGGYTAPDPHAPAALLERLGEGSAWARGLSARHPATPVAMLARLAVDEAIVVRFLVAHNPMAPPTVLLTLAGDTHPRVRQEVARHRQAPAVILERLARDGDRHVRAAAASNAATDPRLLGVLAADPAWKVRREVARRPELAAEVIETLARDTTSSVLYALARRPSLTAGAQDQLATAADPVVRRLIAARHAPRLAGDLPSPPRTSRRRHRRKAMHASAPDPLPAAPQGPRLRTALHALLKAPDPVWQAVALASPALEPALMSAHLHAATWVQRYALACNPAVPHTLLEILSQDTNRLVRAAAEASLHSAPQERTP